MLQSINLLRLLSRRDSYRDGTPRNDVYQLW